MSETKNKFSPIGYCQAMVSNTEREGKGDPTTRPMLGMLIFPNLGKGCPIYGGIDICGVRLGVSELLQAVYAKP